MISYLSKRYVCDVLASVLEHWKRPPAYAFPCFHNETWYAECFLTYLSRLPVSGDSNILPFFSEKMNAALNRSFHTICGILEREPADGTKIFNLMSEQQFILRRDQRTYNRQVPGKSPKGLKAKEWGEYNHWLLSNLYWQGFLLSQEQDFQIYIPEDVVGPIELFLSNETKPLWGMRIKAQEAGTVFIGSDWDCFDVSPYASFQAYFGS